MTTNGKTRLLALLGTLGLAGSLPACGGGSNRCAQLQLSWAVNDAGTNQRTTCQAVGADTVTVTLNGADFSFPCGNMAGVTTGLPPGTYSARVRLSGAGAVLSDTGAMSVTLQGCGKFDLNNNAPIIFDVDTGAPACAQVQLSWAINELATNTPLTCEAVPANEVRLLLSGVEYSFPCNAFAGITPAVSPGTYTARVGLFDQGTSVSETGTMNITLPGCGTFDLNNNVPVVFDVN